MTTLQSRFLFIFLIGFRLLSISQSFTINVNGPVPAGFVSALVTAGQKWSQYLKINVPIKVNVSTVNSAIFPFSGITFANGRKNFVNAPYSNFLYTTALANQIAGVETNPGEYDMDIYFNLSVPFYYGTGKPNNAQLDFLSVAMHEIGHGLGFYSDGYVNSSNVGSFGNIPQSAIYPATTSFPWRGQDGVPTIYDKYLVTQSQNPLVNCAAPNSVALGDSIKLHPIYFSGPLYANALNLNRPKMVESGYGYFSFGQDLLHPYDTTGYQIMGNYWGTGDTVHSPALVELGIFKEIGWNLVRPVGLNHVTNDKATVELYPNPASKDLFISGEGIQSVRIFNSVGEITRTVIYSSQKTRFSCGLSDLPPGLYFAEIKVGIQNAPVVRRFVKE